MDRLIKAEFFKLSKLAGYKILLLGTVGIGLAEGLITIIYGVSQGARISGAGYFALKLYLVWPLFAALMAGVYTAVFLCSDFGNRTYGATLLCGLSRRKVFLSKMIVFYAGLLPIFYLHMVVVCVLVTMGYGFGSLTAGDVAEFLKMFFYSVIGYLAVGGYYALLAVWLKNPVATVGVGFGIVYVQLVWVSNLRGMDVPPLKLSFMYQLNQFLDWETFQDKSYFVVMTLTFLLTFVAALFFYVKSDLK